MSNDPLRFMGFTKTQALGVIIALVVILAAVQVYLVDQNTQLAEQGAQSHAALCVYKEDKIKTLAQTQAYIESDTNGTILGFPRSLWVKSEHDLQATVNSLSKLHCAN